MSNIVKFGNAELPTLADVAAALRDNPPVSAQPQGKVFLKMDRTGHWVYGADQTEIEADSVWAINPVSFTHGFIAWGEGAVLLAQKVFPITVRRDDIEADLEPAPVQSPNGWQYEMGFSMVCTSGEDQGLEVRFATTTNGGVRATQGLINALRDQLDKDVSRPVALVKLGKESYQNKNYGRIFNPVFNVLEWVSNSEGAASPSEAEPVRRRRG